MTLLATIIVFGVLVTIHEWGHFIIAKRQGVQVDVFSIGFGPKLLKYQWHNTLYAISLIPLGGYIKMAGDEPDEAGVEREPHEFFAKTPWQRMKIVMAGPFMNYILAFIIFAFIFMVGSPMATSRIGDVIAGYPAQLAGLQKGDKIVSINAVEVDYWDDLIKQIRLAAGEPISLTVLRGEQSLDFTLNTKTAKDEKKTTSRPVIGIKPSDDVQMISYPVLESLLMAGEKLYMISYLTYRSLWQMVTGKLSMRESMTGPVGIIFITGETAKKGWIHLLHLMGLLSAALALFNFLPIPVLDGGHFVLYLFEWIRKSPLNLKVQDNFQRLGMFFLLTLMVFVFYNDFVNFKVFSRVRSLWVTKQVEGVPHEKK
jgi:regulator of sigma E protease